MYEIFGYYSGPGHEFLVGRSLNFGAIFPFENSRTAEDRAVLNTGGICRM